MEEGSLGEAGDGQRFQVEETHPLGLNGWDLSSIHVRSPRASGGLSEVGCCTQQESSVCSLASHQTEETGLFRHQLPSRLGAGGWQCVEVLGSREGVTPPGCVSAPPGTQKSFSRENADSVG